MQIYMLHIQIHWCVNTNSRCMTHSKRTHEYNMTWVSRVSQTWDTNVHFKCQQAAMRCNSTGLSGTRHLNRWFILIHREKDNCPVCAWGPDDHRMFLPPRTRPRGTPPGCHTPGTWKGPSACAACGSVPPSTSGRCGRAPGSWPSPSPSLPDLGGVGVKEGFSEQMGLV